MKLLDGRDLAGFIQERHSRIVAGLGYIPTLAIVCVEPDQATKRYLKMKQRYADEIGVRVDLLEVDLNKLSSTIANLNTDGNVTGIIVQLPLPQGADTDSILSGLALDKDVDGLVTNSVYEPATAKAIMWLLAGYNVDVAGKWVAVVGQGRLVGQPISLMLESAAADVHRYDIHSTDLSELVEAQIIICATGKPSLISSGMIGEGAVVVDVRSPLSELADDVADRTDIIRTPNPGGVGPMTVAALFDNLLIAAQRS